MFARNGSRTPTENDIRFCKSTNRSFDHMVEKSSDIFMTRLEIINSYEKKRREAKKMERNKRYLSSSCVCLVDALIFFTSLVLCKIQCELTTPTTTSSSATTTTTNTNGKRQLEIAQIDEIVSSIKKRKIKNKLRNNIKQVLKLRWWKQYRQCHQLSSFIRSIWFGVAMYCVLDSDVFF